MPKGVSKISCVQLADQTSDVNYIVVKPERNIDFYVKEWLAGTPETEKSQGAFWIRQNESRTITLEHTGGNRPYNKAGKRTKYTIRLTKKQCGRACYFIEGSYSGEMDLKNRASIRVRGNCPPRVISSRWDEVNSSKGQIKRSNPTKFGKSLKLQLEVEGLNGFDCTIHVYNAEAGKDQFIKSYAVKCEEGNIEYTFSGAETTQWRKIIGFEKGLEQFYIELSASGVKERVTDTLGDQSPNKLRHAAHLFFEGWITEQINAVLPKTNKVLTTGNHDVNPIKYDPCTFEQINFTDKLGTKYILFEKSKVSQYQIRDTPYHFGLKMMYATDAYEVPRESENLVKNVGKFLKANPHLNVTIHGFTDIRHTDDYNQVLSDRRANAVKSYLNVEGVKNKMTAKGFGERTAKQFVYLDNRDSALHKVNRRTLLSFEMPQHKTLVLNLITPTSPQKYGGTMEVKGYKVNTCASPFNHKKKKAKFVQLVNNNGQVTVVEEKDLSSGSFTIPIYSTIGDDYPFTSNFFPNRFEFRINSCNYYSDPAYSTVVINAFTDTLWLFEGRYDYSAAYTPTIRGITHQVPLVTGATQLLAIVQDMIDAYKKIFNTMGGQIEGFVMEVILSLFSELTNKFQLGYVKRYDFVSGKYEEQNYTEKYRKETEWIIVGLATLSIILELIIIYLSRGRSLVKKFPKLEKMSKGLRKFKEIQELVKSMSGETVELEVNEPKVLANYHAYLLKEGKQVKLLQNLRVVANPLLGVKLKIDQSLKKFINDSTKGPEQEGKDPFTTGAYWEDKLGKVKEESIKKLLDKVGVNAELLIDISGNIVLDYDLQVPTLIHNGTLENKLTIKDQVHENYSNQRGRSISGTSIAWNVKIVLENKRVVFDKGRPATPFDAMKFIFGGVTSLINVSLNASLEGTIIVGTEHSVRDGGVYMRYLIHFSGIKGNFKFVLGSSQRESDRKESNNLPTGQTDNGDFTLTRSETFYTNEIKII
ncbi:MAG: OmpA family protein [Sphingobacterium sp.]|jgi:hypothetical protein|nr:OmpA family protein [Sphingobacterium sp.]